MAPSLLSIPAELQVSIISYLPRPSDLKRLCLTCRELRERARQQLYKHVRVYLDDDQNISGILGGDKIGHKHVRALTFGVRDKANDTDSAWRSARSRAGEYRRLIRLVLPIVPRNRLQHLTVSGVTLDSITLHTLVDQQTVLREMDLGCLAPDATSFRPIERWRELFTSLIIPKLLADVAELDFYTAIIHSSASLKHLALGASGASGNIATMRLLLGHTENDPPLGHTVRPLELASLCIREHSLRERGQALVKGIDFERLEQLHVYVCRDTNVLLDAMSDLFEASSANVRLKSIIVDTTANHGSLQTVTALQSLQRLLRSFVGLEVLQVRSDIELTSWDMSCLANHYPTLQVLYLGLGTDDPDDGRCHWLMAPPEMEKLFSSCPRLSQVSLAMPDITLREADTDNYSGYVNALRLISEAPSLRLLRILTWPDAHDEHHGRPLSDWETEERTEHASPYFRHVDAFATKILGHFGTYSKKHLPQLKMLCIGDTHNEDKVALVTRESITVPESLYYVAGHQRDCLGREGAVAIPIAMSEVKYMAPEFIGVTAFGTGTSTASRFTAL